MISSQRFHRNATLANTSASAVVAEETAEQKAMNAASAGKANTWMITNVNMSSGNSCAQQIRQQINQLIKAI